MVSAVNDYEYDVIIIGGGPGGYTAAARTSEKGLKTLLIEANKLGGVCLNAGCIPTKTLLHTAKLYGQMTHSDLYGLALDAPPRLDWPALMNRKNRVVERLRNGVRFQMARQKVELIEGYATFIDRQTVQVGDEVYHGRHIVLATGAAPVLPSFPGAEHLLTTTDLLTLESLPEQLLILGANPIALGMACIFALLGVQVGIIDESADLLPEFDPELVAALRPELPPIAFYLGQQVNRIEKQSDSLALMLGDGQTLLTQKAAYIGPRRPNIHNMNLENIGLDLSNGRIAVDERMQTNLPGLYAIGDVTGISMWAHTAQRMGEVVATTIIGGADRLNTALIPTVIYTEPQLATVGLTEEQARSRGYTVRVGRLPLNYNGRYLAEHDIEDGGLCKVVVDAHSQRLLGVHIVGGNASELIFGAAAMLADEFRVQDLQQVLFAHPTISEVIKDALYEL